MSGPSGNPDAAIRVDGLRKSYGTGDAAVTAVEDVSFEIQDGSIVGLLGPNGAGKTTTIESMLGLVVPDAGTVEICGIDVFEDPQRAHGHVGAMLEGERNVYWRLTVRENLEFFAGLGGQRPDAVRDRHDRLLDRLDLADRADTVVNELSTGMKQKVSLASTLARDVDVIFLDEPTLGLDVETAQELRAELRRLADEAAVTIVLTSHDMDVVEAVSDRVLIMQDGRLIADDDVENLLGVLDTQSYSITVEHGIHDALRERIETVVDRARSAGVAPTVDITRKADGDRISLECHAVDSQTIYALMDAFAEAGVELVDVQSIDPDLEEVFLHLTGAGESPEPPDSPEVETTVDDGPVSTAEAIDAGVESASRPLTESRPDGGV